MRPAELLPRPKADEQGVLFPRGFKFLSVLFSCSYLKLPFLPKKIGTREKLCLLFIFNKLQIILDFSKLNKGQYL